MRFTRLEIHEVCIPLRITYRHALADRSEATSLIIAVTTDSGDIGWGEAIPRSYLTGESLESAVSDIQGRWWPRVRELEIKAFSELPGAMMDCYAAADQDGRTASYAGLELACIDAAGKAFKRPARELVIETLSLSEAPAKNTKILYTAPLGGGNLESTCRLAKLFKFLGFREFKLKLGYSDDEERVAAVRAVVGASNDLRVDANAAWDVDTALQRCEVLKKHNISSLEQPVAATDLTSMARIQQGGGVAVMADEALCNRNDARMLIKAGACSIFNIRLGKCGGYLGSLEMLKLAQAAGLTSQLGVLVGETSILTSAGQEFLAGIGPQRHHETSFPKFFLKGNPARGEATPLWGGATRLRPPQPGFGIKVSERALKKITVKHLAVE